MSYSDAMIAELKATEVWNYEKATDFATKYKQKPRSVVAKVIALGLTYEKADGTKKATKTAKTSKAEMVLKIESVLGVKLKTLDKVNMDDLVILLEAVDANA